MCLGLIANEASAIRDMSLFIVKNITHQRNQWGVDAPPSSIDDDSSGDDESEEEEETAPNKEKGSSSRRMEQLLAHLRSMCRASNISWDLTISRGTRWVQQS